VTKRNKKYVINILHITYCPDFWSSTNYETSILSKSHFKAVLRYSKDTSKEAAKHSSESVWPGLSMWSEELAVFGS
jgi:hypothetical protein